MDLDLRNIRQDYRKRGLLRKQIPNNPFVLFEKWLNEAIKEQVNEPTAMLVSTVSPSNKPASRTVLLKEFKNSEFVFYTNYESRKGIHLEHNPSISLSFIWHELERQIHIEGIATKVNPKQADEYFLQRPLKSQIGARISPQSRPIKNRGELIKKFILESSKWVGRGIKRPNNWGGYTVKATRIEFWQGRANRLHDRFLYEIDNDGSWNIQRLAP